MYKILARYRLPYIASFVVTRHQEKMKHIFDESKNNSHDGKKYRILVLYSEKSGFVEDIEILAKLNKDFEFVKWPYNPIKHFAEEILSESIENNFYVTEDEKIERTKQDYRKFLRKMWRGMSLVNRIDAVLTPNFSYAKQHELGAALEELGTPFIALHKENFNGITPRRAEYWRYLYTKRRGKFAGRKIVVFNRVEKELQISGQIAASKDIIVSGMPRLDRAHEWRLDHAKGPKSHHRPQVLFFSFGPNEKLPHDGQISVKTKTKEERDFYSRWNGLTWGSFFEDTHRAIIDLARQMPDVRVIIKFKSAAGVNKSIIQMIEENIIGEIENIEILSSGNSLDLIFDSDVVIGFNTTSLLEALAAGKPIVVPSYGEALNSRTRDFCLDFGNTAHYARSPKEILTISSRLIRQKKVMPKNLNNDVKELLERWTGNIDGKASYRVSRAVRKEIERASR